MCRQVQLLISQATSPEHFCQRYVGSTTKLPSHSAQVKEARRSLYDSESGVKKMAVGHHLNEHSHAIERSHNLLSGERVERQDFVNLEEGGSERVWDQCRVEIWVWDWRGSGSGPVCGVGVCVGKLVPINTSAIFWSSRVGCGKEYSV